MAATARFSEFDYFIKLVEINDDFTHDRKSFFSGTYLSHLHYTRDEEITNGSFIEFLKDITILYIYLEGMFRKTLGKKKRDVISVPKLMKEFFKTHTGEDASQTKIYIERWGELINQYKHTAFTLMDTFEINVMEYHNPIENLPETHFFRGTNENLVALTNVMINVLARVKASPKK